MLLSPQVSKLLTGLGGGVGVGGASRSALPGGGVFWPADGEPRESLALGLSFRAGSQFHSEERF